MNSHDFLGKRIVQYIDYNGVPAGATGQCIDATNHYCMINYDKGFGVVDRTLSMPVYVLSFDKISQTDSISMLMMRDRK